MVETDAHYPTDVSRLRDSVRGLIWEASRSSGDFGVDRWCQRQHWENTVGDLFEGMRRAGSRRSPGATRFYLKVCLKLVDKAEGSLAELKGTDCRSDPASWKAPASKSSAADSSGLDAVGRRPEPTPCSPSNAA